MTTINNSKFLTAKDRLKLEILIEEKKLKPFLSTFESDNKKLRTILYEKHKKILESKYPDLHDLIYGTVGKSYLVGTISSELIRLDKLCPKDPHLQQVRGRYYTSSVYYEFFDEGVYTQFVSMFPDAEGIIKNFNKDSISCSPNFYIKFEEDQVVVDMGGTFDINSAWVEDEDVNERKIAVDCSVNILRTIQARRCYRLYVNSTTNELSKLDTFGDLLSYDEELYNTYTTSLIEKESRDSIFNKDLANIVNGMI